MNAPSHPDPYQVSEALIAEEGKPWRPGWCAYLSALGLILALLGAYGVHLVQLIAHEERCFTRLRSVELAAAQYADDKGTYPYVGGDWEATVGLLIRTGYLDYRPSCPHQDGPGGYDGFKAPFPRGVKGALIAWDVHPHGTKPRHRLAYSDTHGSCLQAEFGALIAKHEPEFARVLAERAAKTAPTK